jgi:hypothetical protein
LEKRKQKILGTIMLPNKPSAATPTTNTTTTTITTTAHKQLTQKHEGENHNMKFWANDFPWSKKTKELMQTVFGVKSFRYKTLQ